MVESKAGGFQFDAAAGRMQRIMVVLTAAGALGFGIAKGLNWGLSFLVGAVLSMGSFRYMLRFVRSIGPGAETKPSTLKAVLVGSRYLLLAGLIYVLVKMARVNVLGAMVGLLVGAAAVIVEMVLQVAMPGKGENQ